MASCYCCFRALAEVSVSSTLSGVQTIRMVLDSAVMTRKMDSSFELTLHFQGEESPKKPLLIHSNGHDTEHLNPKVLRRRCDIMSHPRTNINWKDIVQEAQI